MTYSSRPVSSGSWKMGPRHQVTIFSFVEACSSNQKNTGENNLFFMLSTELVFFHLLINSGKVSICRLVCLGLPFVISPGASSSLPP